MSNYLDYVTSDEECEYNKKSTSNKSKPIQIDSDNELFVDDDESSVDLDVLDEKLKSYENESSKSPNLFSDCNISEIETNLDVNNNNNNSAKKRFSLNQYLKSENAKRSQEEPKNDEDIILIDDDDNSIISGEINKPTRLIVNKPDFSDESNISESFFNKSSPIQISSENDSIVVKKSDSEKISLNNYLNVIDEDLNKDDSSNIVVALSSSLSEVRVNTSSNDSFLPDVAKKSSQHNNSSLNCDKLNNSKAVVMVRKLSAREIEKHTRLNQNNSNNNSNASFKLTLFKNKESNTYNVKTNNSNAPTTSKSQASSSIKRTQTKKPILDKETDNDFIIARVKKPKKKEETKSKSSAQIEKSTKNDPIVKKSDFVSTKIPIVKKTDDTKATEAKTTSTTAASSLISTSTNETSSALNKMKFKIPKIATSNNKSPIKTSTANPTTSKSSSLKKTSESIKKSIKILSSQSNDPKNKLKKSQAIEPAISTNNKKKDTKETKKNELPKQPILSILKENETKKEQIKVSSQLISTQPNLNLSALNDKRLEYNKSNGWDYPLYSLSFLVDDHVSQLSKQGGSLDFNLLNANIEKTDDPLCVSQLTKDERLELCKLMSRSAGRFNKYSLFGIDSSLRENLISSTIDFKKYGKHADNLRNNLPLEFENEAEEDQFLSNEIPKLTLSESFVLYEHFAERLTSPWRKIKLFYDSNLKANNIQVEFSNNKLIESTDASYEACVKYVCHRNKYDLLVNTFLFNNVVVEDVEKEAPKNLIDEAKKKINDNQVFDKFFLDNFFDKLKKSYDGPVIEQPSNVFHVNFHPDGYPIIDKSNYSFVDRCKRLSVDLPNTVNNNRFDGFITRLNSNRGAMKYAFQHKPISDIECNRRLDKIKEDTNLELNLNEIFDTNSNTN